MLLADAIGADGVLPLLPLPLLALRALPDVSLLALLFLVASFGLLPDYLLTLEILARLFATALRLLADSSRNGAAAGRAGDKRSSEEDRGGTGMTNTEHDNDRAEILGVLRACHAAMVKARTDQLADLVDPEYCAKAVRHGSLIWQ